MVKTLLKCFKLRIAFILILIWSIVIFIKNIFIEGFTELRSQPLSPTPSHSHPLPIIFQEKQPTPTHFSTKATHSHQFFNKNNSLLSFFKESDPLPPIFQDKQPTPTHFLTKTTPSHRFFKKINPLSPIFRQKPPHSYQFFNQNDPLPLNFREERQTPTHFSTKTSHSQPFLMDSNLLPPSFNKNNPIPSIFQQIRPTPTYFSTKVTRSHHSHPFFHRSSTKATCIHQFSSYNRLSLPVTINAINELSLENIIFEYSASKKNWKGYFSKN